VTVLGSVNGTAVPVASVALASGVTASPAVALLLVPVYVVVFLGTLGGSLFLVLRRRKFQKPAGT
jgi:hypothetical protein